VIRFRHVTKELFSSVAPFLLRKPYGQRDRKTSRGLAFALQNLLRRKPNRDDLKLLLDAEREDGGVFFNRRVSRTDRQVT
jgi:hypothetical protein